MKKLLSILLAILCVMNLTVVSFAAEDVSYFDEETGTLYMMTESWIEDLGISDEGEKYAEFLVKVKSVYIGNDYMSDYDSSRYDNLVMLWFPNVEKVMVDDEHPGLYVYDKALYTKSDHVMIYYPLASDDTDIVLSPGATNIELGCFVDFFEQVYGKWMFQSYHPIDKEYNLYINSADQLGDIVNRWHGDALADRLFYARFNNIYVNAEQSEIDAVSMSVLDLDTKFLWATYTAFCTYCNSNYFFGDQSLLESCQKMDDVETIMADYIEKENFDETEFYRVYFERITKMCYELGYKEFTKERFETVLAAEEGLETELIENYGSLDVAFEIIYNVYEVYYNHFLYLYNRGNPVKPLSTLTSGNCGEGAEWAIDRENGVLSITGNGAIVDNYSGFDVFKDIATTVEIGNGITAIGENVFTGFTALTETKFDGTQSQWVAVAVAEGNDDLLKNVTVNLDPPVEPEQPKEETTFWDKVVDFFNEVANFFIKIFDWFKNLLGI